MNDIHWIGPTRQGMFGWKFFSSRFKTLFGNAYQCSPFPEVAEIAEKRCRKEGKAYKRRLDGKNGWLWKTLLDLKAELSDIEWGNDPRFIVVPLEPTIREQLALRLFGR